jgi:uncharacterized sulfatase
LEKFKNFIYEKRFSVLALLLLFSILRVYLSISVSSNSLYSEVYILWKTVGFLYDVWYVLFISAVILLLSFFVSLLSKKVSNILFHSLVLLVLFIEIGLQQYYLTMFQALDESVYYFSLNELKLIIGLADRLTFGAVFGILVMFAIYFGLIFSFKKVATKRSSKRKFYFAFLLLGFLTFPFANYSSETEIVRVGLVNNKTSYFIHRSLNYFFKKEKGEIQINPSEFKDLDKDFYQHTSSNVLYPVFQPLADSSALAPYFKDSDKKPNIVFVIVESLSSELIGENGKQTGQLMPFLDSLSQESLFFPNTLSTAERTHNVLPATLCSLPNSVDGTVFQQIEYPNHWSLMSLLKKDYFSRFYCGVKMEFINMQGFMRFQKTDLLSEKWSEENRKDSARIKASWGFPDECIYRQSEQDLEEIKTNKALFDVFLTISSHDPFKYPNQAKWISLAKKKLSKLKNRQLRKDLLANVEAMGSYSYSDFALRDFFQKWKQKDEFNNTIFIITGDHGTERCQIDPLSPYKVPILIYSPLLKKSKTINSISTHLDLPVSLLNLLKQKYKQSVPESLPFIGKEMDMREEYHADRSIVFSSTQWRSDNVFSKGYALIDNQLYDLRKSIRPKKTADKVKITHLQNQIKLYQNFSRYLIHQNKLVPPEIHDQVFGTIVWTKIKEWKGEILAEMMKDKYILLGQSAFDNQWKNMRVQVETEVFLNSEKDIDSIMEIGITADFHKKMKRKYLLFKNIKPILVEKFKKGKRNKLKYTLEFSPKTFEKLRGKKKLTYYFYNRLDKKQEVDNYSIKLYSGK